MRSEAKPTVVEGWPVWRRRAVSLIIVVHATAILLAILAGGARRSPPPLVFAAGYLAAGPYLRTMHLDNPYRFFAPDPGATVTLWIRTERQDSEGRTFADWREYPDRQESTFRQGYERGLVRAARVCGGIGPDASDPSELALSPLGVDTLTGIVKARIESVARYAAGNARPTDGVITGVEVYVVQRRLPGPDECAAGMGLYDLRLYRTCRAARFDDKGEQIESARPAAAASSAVAGLALADLEHAVADKARLPKSLALAAESAEVKEGS
ncbi:MAG TPA: hypothetical protein VNC50_06245, partial [Planctomycetia bacterium]|nr:hypothetical protein [Planctomycetia bacterium]